MQSEPLSILQVITPHRFAGAERICAQLAQRLIARGHHAYIAAPPRCQAFLDYVASLKVPLVSLPLGGKLNLRAPRLLASLALDLQVDLFHSHLSTASLHTVRAARLSHLPAICHVHAMSGTRWYRGADLILACTEGVARHLLASGLNDVPVQVVHNGVLPEEFDQVRPPEEMRAELELAPDAPVIGIVASLTKRKGHVYLFHALQLLADEWPHLTCLCLGDGPLLGRLTKLARSLDIADQVRFLGFRDDRLDVIQICDLLVLPSTGIEGFGLCIIEAAMLGIPAIASRLPGVDEAVLDGQTGLLVPPRDPEALAQAINRLLSDRTERRQLGNKARRRVRAEFTIDAMAKATEAAYRRVLSRAASA